MAKLVILGAGGHSKDVIWLIERINSMMTYESLEIVGLLDDDPEKIGKTLNGYPILDFRYRIKDTDLFVCGVGSPKTREKMEKKALELYMKPATLFDPTAIIHPSATIGEGTIVMANAVISANSVIGKHSIIHYDCLVGHDCNVGDYVTLFPGCKLCGGVKTGKGTQIGSNATIIPYKSIGSNVIVGAGTVVCSDFKDDITLVGLPARILKVAR
jgi:acetyltransferase EpsM